MLVSAAGMGCCMAIIAGCSSAEGNQSAVATAAAFIYLFSTFFPVGFLGLSFLYSSEISPLNLRTYITSMSTGTVWMSNFVVAEMTPAILDDIKGRYYIVYACINLFLIVPTVYLFFPETSQRTLEEMDEIFRNSSNAFQPVKASRQMVRRKDSVAVDKTGETGSPMAKTMLPDEKIENGAISRYVARND